MPLSHQGVAHSRCTEGLVVSRDFQSGAGDRVRRRVVGIQVGVEAGKPTVFFCEGTVVIPPETERYRQIAAQLVVIVHKGPHRVGTIVAIR